MINLMAYGYSLFQNTSSPTTELEVSEPTEEKNLPINNHLDSVPARTRRREEISQPSSEFWGTSSFSTEPHPTQSVPARTRRREEISQPSSDFWGTSSFSTESYPTQSVPAETRRREEISQPSSDFWGRSSFSTESHPTQSVTAETRRREEVFQRDQPPTEQRRTPTSCTSSIESPRLRRAIQRFASHIEGPRYHLFRNDSAEHVVPQQPCINSSIRIENNPKPVVFKHQYQNQTKTNLLFVFCLSIIGFIAYINYQPSQPIIKG